MANFTTKEIFGNDVSFYVDPDSQDYRLIIDITNFTDVGNGSFDRGEIQDNLGLSNLASDSFSFDPTTPAETSKAYKLLYALMLLVIQNQAENINADPEQKIFISSQPARLASGSRNGQIQRGFTVNFFTPGSVDAIPDIDDI